MALPVFDMHCDTADRLSWQTLSSELKRATGMDFYGPGDEAAPTECSELAHNRGMISLEKVGATPWAQCLACYIPDQLSPEQSLSFYKHVSAYMRKQLAANADKAQLATSIQEVRPVLEGGTAHFAALATIENARLFAADLSLIEKLSNQGVIMASISWNSAGPLASGHDTHQGLTSLGEAAVSEMQRVGMVIDVSHLNDECFAQVASLTKAPLVASHSNARAVCAHKRNLTDEQFRLIRDRGGVVGLNYCSGFLADGAWGEQAPGVSFEQTVAHLEHWLDLDGQDTIALGGDWDGADVPAFLADASCMPAFQERLISHFGQKLSKKLCYDNALTFFERHAR